MTTKTKEDSSKLQIDIDTIIQMLPVLGSILAVLASVAYKWLTARPKMREGLAADPIGFALFIYEIIQMMLAPATVLVYGDEILKVVQSLVAIIVNDLADGQPDTLREVNRLLLSKGVRPPPSSPKGFK
jgi:hypothetical protein